MNALISKSLFTPKMIVLSATLSLGCLGSHVASAADTAAGEAVEEVVKGAKHVGRAASDKGCELVNGRTQCALKKGKHKLQNAADEVTK